MRKLVLVLLILILIVAALAIYLVATVPGESAGVRLPLTDPQRALLAVVPSDAETFAFIPTAAAARAKLETNPITRGAIAAWAEQRWMPEAWMLGDADLVIWQSNGQASYAFQLDPVRSLLFRAYVTMTRLPFRAERGIWVGGSQSSAGRNEVDLDLASTLPAGDALVVQRGGENMFPPIERPSVSMISVEDRDITITSRAATGQPQAGPPRNLTLPEGGLLSAWFGEPPRLMRDIDRIVPGDLAGMLGGGGGAVLYDVDMGLLLPRPKGVFVIPATAEAREGAQQLQGLADLVGDIDIGSETILFALDRSSAATYRAEQMTPLSFPASEWALRIDAARMIPLLERLGDHTGLRFAAPRLYRSVRDLRSWIRHLDGADRIDAVLTAGGGHEELRVRITPK